MQKDRVKLLLPIAVVLLLITIALSPGITADDHTVSTKVLTVWMPGITEDDYSVQMEVEQQKITEINNTLNDFLVVVENALNPDGPGGFNIIYAEWQELKVSIIGIVDKIKEIVGDDFPEFNIDEFTESIITSLLNPFKWYFQRAGIFSVGRGFAWIPFYDYDTFIGVMIRPIFITHLLGFTGAYHFNPFPIRVEYADRIGLYRVSTLAFVGLFINFGDILREQIVGPVILIGKGYNALGSDWP